MPTTDNPSAWWVFFLYPGLKLFYVANGCRSGTRTPIVGTRNRSPTIRRIGKDSYVSSLLSTHFFITLQDSDSCAVAL